MNTFTSKHMACQMEMRATGEIKQGTEERGAGVR
jgi:hypothetical protein